jgi:hypothetical protein
MPQTSDAVLAIIAAWFPDRFSRGPTGTELFSPDYLCHKVLLSKGWTEHAGMFSPPVPSYYGPREDYILLKYLVEEWDYAYECPPLIGVK